MLGLMGTLIPLGPGIIALGQGDTYTLSTSLLMAFDTTVAGLACAAAALIISTIRKRWYRNYMSMLETLMECTLEAENKAQAAAAAAQEKRKARLQEIYQKAYLACLQQGYDKEQAIQMARQTALEAARADQQNAAAQTAATQTAAGAAAKTGSSYLEAARGEAGGSL